MRLIEVDVDDIPYHFEVELGDKSYTMYLEYNSIGDFFTITTYYEDEIISSEKLVLDKPLFTETYKKNTPTLDLIPFSLVESISRITYDNFNTDVFLCVVDLDDYTEDEINEILA